MALSSTDLTTIVNQVLSALRTNAKTISDLTPVTELLDNDFFEVAGGKKVSYGVLKTLIAGLSASEQSSLLASVNKKELSKVELTLSTTSAVLKISSKEKDITCTIPVATDSKGGFMSAADKIKLDSAYNSANSANNVINSGVLKKFSHLEEAPDKTTVVFDSSTGSDSFVLSSATSGKSGLMSSADKNKLEEAYSNASEAKSILDDKGYPNGIATLDSSGRIPSSQLPGYVDDVIEFHAIVSDITVQLASSLHASTDLGCDVVYDTTSNRFVLAAPSADGVISYYANWVDGESFGRTDTYGKIPESGKIYTCVSDNKTFRWSGSTLVAIGSDLALGRTSSTAFPGDAGKTLEDNVAELNKLNISAFGGIVEDATSLDTQTMYFSRTLEQFLFMRKYFKDKSAGSLEIANGSIDYITVENGGTFDYSQYLFRYADGIYKFNGSTLELITDAEHAYTQNEVEIRSHINAHTLLCKTFDEKMTLKECIDAVNAYTMAHKEYAPMYRLGTILTFQSEEGWVSYQFIKPGGFTVEDNWQKTGGGASVGNTYNLTSEVPTPVPSKVFYSMDSADEYYAPDVVLANNKQAFGLQITFAIKQGSWKTYQYIGTDLLPDSVRDKDNWLDLAGMSAGAEPILNVDLICGPKDRTLSMAVQDILDATAATGIDYFKEGLVITYRRDSSDKPFVWETKQFVGEKNDFSPTSDLWKDFGNGGGSSVATTNAISTENDTDKAKVPNSGAVADFVNEKAIVSFEEQPDPEYYIFQGVNAKGTPVGDPVKILKSNGTGGQSGSTLTIYCDQAINGAFGSKITLNAAIKSVSYDGEDEILGTIRTISIIDPTSNLTLWTDTVNTSSSSSANDRKFKYDFTDFMTSASSKDFIIKATDADGNSRTRTITVTAVDVTCKCLNSLNWDKDQVLTEGSSNIVSIPMYKFENNVSRQGIHVVTEIYYNGAWRQLGEATITDTYSHNISLNANDLFGGGEKMTHGGYPIRIKGKDVASGVEGNTIYTGVMCVDPNSTEPIVVMRYDDRNNGNVRLYDSISIDVAAYTPNQTRTSVEVVVDNVVVQSASPEYSQTLNVSKQIQGYATDGSATFNIYARSASARTAEVPLTVVGSAIDVATKSGAVFALDMSTRSNNETDHTISNKGITMNVEGCNWSSNGFKNILGEQVLRLAENVKAEINYAPFSSSSIETAGGAIQFAFSTNRIKDKNAKLMECYDPAMGVGFYVCGNEIVMTALTGTPNRQRVPFKCGEKITVAIVVEPATKSVMFNQRDNGGNITGFTEYSMVKLYINGELCGIIGYKPNTNAIRQSRTIKFDSASGDFNLNYFIAYNTHMEWLEAFQNYLGNLSNVDAMIAEYDKENVLDNSGKPSMSLLAAKGIPYYVIVADQDTFDNFDYKLNGGTDTGDEFACTLYYYNPQHPEVNFKATNVFWRRQGTTSAQRPIKNDRFNFNKKHKKAGIIGKTATVTLLNPSEETELGRKAILAAKYNKVYVSETGFFVDVVTVKVDYSDSSNANDCGVCDMMNATFRALGSSYMTPAQRAFDGRQILKGDDILNGLQMDHSTKNHPVACFRAKTETLQDAWFHAKGNWKEDKGEQVALGFKDTPGYNLGCLNYGDFIEFFGNKGETLAQAETRFKATSGLDTSKPYIISQYCGLDYAIYRYKNGAWVRSTGSMKQVGGKWVVTGDVLNPVSGYELLQYAGMDWWQGVATVEDMMAPTVNMSSWVKKLGIEGATTFPAWTFYFECMIDDDQLQLDLALGKKVPYDLFNMLRFFNSCDYSKVNGWEATWQKFAWRYMSLESAMAYTAFTDYLAAVDQRAKNMQPMFFLEDGCSVENGMYKGYNTMEPLRMYLNKVYDCDTCNGSDNDGARDIDPEVDPNKPTDEEAGYSNPYMGRGSVLFNNIDKQPSCWNDIEANIDEVTGKGLISLKGVVSKMRSLTTDIKGRNVAPFSPAGAMYFFVEQRLQFWPKVVSSYDGERKYIDNTNIANQVYFYALHGLGLTSMPRFIEQRWAIRDGYYQCGDFYTNPLTIRMVALSSKSKIRITAGVTGYYGVGNDGTSTSGPAPFLEAGESYEFTEFDHGQAQIRIYQPGRLRALDLSEMSLASGDALGALALCEELILGGSKHTSNPSTGFGSMTGVLLGDMPFLRVLDVSNTTATNIDASNCPRLETIDATNTPLTTCEIAQTAPVDSVKLPASITSLQLVNLPKLSYPGGLELASVVNVNKLWIEGSPYIDTEGLLMKVATEGQLKAVRLPDVNIIASVAPLRIIYNNKVVGMSSTGQTYENATNCVGLIGRWIMTELIEESELATLNAYFPDMQVINSQYSCILYSDAEADTENISNIDDKTGYKFGNKYTKPGHWVKMEQESHAYKSSFNAKDGKMYCTPISDSTYTELADGTSYDPTDMAGEGFDVMKHIPNHYMKGVNDFKNQEKYTFLAVADVEPISTIAVNPDGSLRMNRAKLANLLVAEQSCIYTDELIIGGEFEQTLNANMNVYAIDVDGMKQVRWPGINHAQLGAVFVNADGKVVGTFNMSISHSLFDFSFGDYIFCDVPRGAVKFFFTAPRGYDDQEAIAVDSSAIEAIEPDWVFYKEYLAGVYGGSIDSLMQIRSVSGQPVRRGTETHITNVEWDYDENGELTNKSIPTSQMNYTSADLINLCRMRGRGFQAQDYEMHNDIAQIIYGIVGDRDIQAKCGYGCTQSYTTGAANTYGNITRFGSSSGELGNILFGLQNYIGCSYESMDGVGINISNFLKWRKAKYSYTDSSYIDDAKWHIFDFNTRTERVVQGINVGDYSIARTKHGRYCDIIASRVSTDKSLWNQHYCDAQYYIHSHGRLPRRGGSGAFAYGGLACVNASNAATNAGMYYGVRLAFRGEIVFVRM